MREAESREQLCMVGGGPCLEPRSPSESLVLQSSEGKPPQHLLKYRDSERMVPEVGQCPSLLPCQQRCKGAAFYSSLLDSWLLGDR